MTSELLGILLMLSRADLMNSEEEFPIKCAPKRVFPEFLKRYGITLSLGKLACSNPLLKHSNKTEWDKPKNK